jgi:hypothetical protein
MTYDFTSDLTVGSTGAQVTALQAFLIAQGDLTAVSAPTGYFGALTQAALAKFQAANGITPSVGYFGPKTRAFVNAMSSTTTTTTTTTTGSLPAGCTSTSGFSPTTGASCATGVSSVTAPATGLQVGLASNNPTIGSLISSVAGSGGGSAARVPVLSFDLTAGNSGAVTVSAIEFQKAGVLSDSAVSNAYLVQNGQVVAEYASLSNGLLTFSGLDLSIPAGQTEEYTLAIGVSSGLSAGNTTGFSIPSASDVTAWDVNNSAITPVGPFPLNGNTFTVTQVSNPALATLTITSSSIGNSVTAGTQGNIVGSWLFNVGVNPVYLQNLNFHVIGSANVANIQNVKLLVNGFQVGNTLASVPSNGLADFQATSTSLKLNTGSNNVQVVADVLGSPNMNFQFEILNSYDVLAVDSQYNVPIAVSNTGGIGTQVSIQPGTITLNLDSNTPTNNIAKNQSSVTLAEFDLYASGEPVKVQWLDFNIGLTGVSASTTLSNELQNISLTDDAGNQVGSSINTPPSANTCTPASGNVTAGVTGAGSGSTVAVGSDTYSDCFGSSNSPINYIVPANTTRVLSLKANIESGANFSTITGNLVADTNNLQGQISSQPASTNGVNGDALTLVSSSLGVTQNTALGTQSIAAGSSDVRIGSYSFSASSAEGVNLNTISVKLEPSTSTNAFQQLKLLVNGVQFGQTVNSVGAGTTYAFSGSAVNIPAGDSVNVDVYAGTLSNATGTYAQATDLVGYTGAGQVSYSPVTFSGTIPGQTIVFNGQPALTVSLDNTSPAATEIAQGTTGNHLAVFDLLETSDVTGVNVTQLNITENVSSTTSGIPDFSNLTLYANGVPVTGGTVQSPQVTSVSGTAYIWEFQNLSGLTVPAGGSVQLTLQGDTGTKSGGSIVDNSTSSFSIATTTDSVNNTPALAVIARGASGSSAPATITLSGAVGKTMTVVRTFLTAQGALLGASSNRVKGNPDQFGTITFTANNSGPAVVNTTTITFGGSAQPTLSSSTVWLTDQANNVYYPTSVTTNTATFSFGSGTNGYKLAAGGSVVFTINLNTASVASSGNSSETLFANIQSASNVTFTDAQDGTGVPLNLPVSTNPAVQIGSASYAAGS